MFEDPKLARLVLGRSVPRVADEAKRAKVVVEAGGKRAWTKPGFAELEPGSAAHARALLALELARNGRDRG